MKTKEKQFSIRYKFAPGRISNLACALASPAQALESGTFYSSLHPTPRTATINAQPSSLAAVALGKAEPDAPKGKIA